MRELIQYYKDGMKYFTEGNLNRAFNYLTMAAAGGVEKLEINTSIAMILMYKGEFEEAYKIFIDNNKKFRDDISENYLSNFDKINNCIHVHNLAVDLINQNKYELALDQLLFIRNEGFRTINDDMLIFLLYCRKKDYRMCRKILEEIHTVNKEEIFYYEMKNYLDKKNYSKVKMWAVCTAVAIIFSVFIMPKHNVEGDIMPSISTKQIASNKIDKNDVNYKILANMANDIMKGNLYDFQINDGKIDPLKLDSQSSLLYNQLKKDYSNKAEAYFYKNGLELYKNHNYKKASEYLSIAYDNMNGSYLDEHVIFYTAKADKASGKEGIRYYEEYVKKYPKGCYIEECLYDLSLAEYKNNSRKEAEKYASILSEQYPNSIYNNNRIKYIVSNINQQGA
jgi:hypothetical protein